MLWVCNCLQRRQMLQTERWWECKRIFLCKMYNLTEAENRFGNSALDALFLLMEDKFLQVIKCPNILPLKRYQQNRCVVNEQCYLRWRWRKIRKYVCLGYSIDTQTLNLNWFFDSYFVLLTNLFFKITCYLMQYRCFVYVVSCSRKWKKPWDQLI